MYRKKKKTFPETLASSIQWGTSDHGRTSPFCTYTVELNTMVDNVMRGKHWTLGIWAIATILYSGL